ADERAPTLSPNRAPAPTANGWNTPDAAASYSASDPPAGLADPATGVFTFTAEGAGQGHTFTVTDLAGNSASASVTGVNIDKTAPTISGAPDRAANGHAWDTAARVVSLS